MGAAVAIVKRPKTIELTDEQIKQIRAIAVKTEDEIAEKYEFWMKAAFKILNEKGKEALENAYSRKFNEISLEAIVEFNTKIKAVRKLKNCWNSIDSSIRYEIIEYICDVAVMNGAPREIVEKNYEEFDLNKILRYIEETKISRNPGRSIDHTADARLLKLLSFWIDAGFSLRIGSRRDINGDMKPSELVRFVAKYLLEIAPLPTFPGRDEKFMEERYLDRAHGLLRQLKERGLMPKAPSPI